MMMVGLVDKGADKFQRFRHNHEQRVVALVVGAIYAIYIVDRG